MKKIAIQGQAGSYYALAAKAFFGDECEIVPCRTFKETFACLGSGKADYALAAIENSLYGSINENYDLLLQNKFWIMGEVYVRIEHCLVGLPGAELTKITHVHSQAPALGQCEDWLETNLPSAERIEEHDTAGSVGIIKTLGDPTHAAIASQQAAELYELPILAKNIETHHHNFTRFLVLSPTQIATPQASKTSLVLTIRDDTKPGTLYRALGSFAKRDTNLTMLQSRPLIGKAWHYAFYVDIDLGNQAPGFDDVIAELEAHGCQVTVLGSYQNGQHQA